MAELLEAAPLSWTVTQFLNQVVKEFQRLENAPAEVQKLRDLLERLELSVKLLSPVQNADQVAGKWLTALNKRLEKARDLSCDVAGVVDIKDENAKKLVCRRASKVAEKLGESIQDLVSKASTHKWASPMTANLNLLECGTEGLGPNKTEEKSNRQTGTSLSGKINDTRSLPHRSTEGLEPSGTQEKKSNQRTETSLPVKINDTRSSLHRATESPKPSRKEKSNQQTGTSVSVEINNTGSLQHRTLAKNDVRNLGEFESPREKEEGSMVPYDNLLASRATKTDIRHEFSRVEQALSSLNLGGGSTSAVPHETLDGESAEQVPQVEVTFAGDAVLNSIRTHLLEGGYRKWVGLWGMGGIGKTFTARRIYHDPEVQRYFSGGIFWVTISKDQFNAGDVCQRLIQQVRVSPSFSQIQMKMPKNLASAKMYLKKLLQSKRVLLILDNVWKKTEDVLQHLDVVSEKSKSVILVTTRDKAILQGVDKSNKFKIPILSKMDSWLLFSWYAFRCQRRQIPPQLRGIAKGMAMECRGLPLALKVIGSIMASMQLSTRKESLGLNVRDVWRRALDHLQKANLESSEYQKLCGRLQLSLYSLEDQQMYCFLYFAAFLEDNDIPLDKLVTIWIAEGLVKSQEDAKFTLSDLVAKSMIDFTSRRDGECTFRVHDVMKDLARRNLKQKVHTAKETPAPKRCRLYASPLKLSPLPDKWFKSSNTCRAKRADTFQRRLSLMESYLEKFPGTRGFYAPHLQVLLLSSKQQLVSFSGIFGEQSNFQVLDLSQTGIQMVVDGVLRRLTYLVLLDLAGCSCSRKVSGESNDLQSLECLILRDCFGLTELPRWNTLTELRFCSFTVLQHFWYSQQTQRQGVERRVLSKGRQTANDGMEIKKKDQEDEEEEFEGIEVLAERLEEEFLEEEYEEEEAWDEDVKEEILEEDFEEKVLREKFEGLLEEEYYEEEEGLGGGIRRTDPRGRV